MIYKKPTLSGIEDVEPRDVLLKGYKGLGIEISLEDNNIKINRIFPESPLYKTDIKKGFIIDKINGEKINSNFDSLY